MREQGYETGRFVLGLAGDHAVDVLAKGTVLDLRGPEFPVPGAAHTTIAHIPALVVRREADVFELSLACSYAGSFAVWLAEAALEYGCIVE